VLCAASWIDPVGPDVICTESMEMDTKRLVHVSGKLLTPFRTFETAMDAKDTFGWAVVCNPEGSDSF
jgi:hypothetical protein